MVEKNDIIVGTVNLVRATSEEAEEFKTLLFDQIKKGKCKIIVDLNRGGTLIQGVGMYKGLDKKIIFTNVSRRELAILQDFIKVIDPSAFMI